MALPFNLSATLLGFLLGNAMPKAVQVRCVSDVCCAKYVVVDA
jgi:hypothetical protein